VYLSTVGKEGYVEVASQCLQKAHYAQQALAAQGIETIFKAPFFQEFVVKLSGNIAEINQELLKQGIIGGLDLGCYYPELAGNMLLCVTENRTKAQIDALVVGLGAKA
jgi:glycine dehydrogenase subunit 1